MLCKKPVTSFCAGGIFTFRTDYCHIIQPSESMKPSDLYYKNKYPFRIQPDIKLLFNECNQTNRKYIGIFSRTSEYKIFPLHLKSSWKQRSPMFTNPGNQMQDAYLQRSEHVCIYYINTHKSYIMEIAFRHFEISYFNLFLLHV